MAMKQFDGVSEACSLSVRQLLTVRGRGNGLYFFSYIAILSFSLLYRPISSSKKTIN